jgi:hypothetical protein
MSSLKYRVENATVGNQERKIEVDGQVGIFTVQRLTVELVPLEHEGGIIKLDLPHNTEGYPEGADISVTFKPVKWEG